MQPLIPEVLQGYLQALQGATTQAQQPFNYGTLGQVAPWTATQDAAINQLFKLGMAGPQYGPQAAAFLQQAGASTTPQLAGLSSQLMSPFASQAAGYGQTIGSGISNYATGLQQAAPQFQRFSADAVGQYLSPYTKNVVDATQAQFTNANAQQGNALLSQGIRTGNAFGGDRAGVAAAQMANQQQLAQAPVIAGLYNQGYGQALNEYNAQNQMALAAGQLGLQGQIAGGQLGLSGLGLGLQGQTAAQQAALASLAQNQNAGLQAGSLLGNLGISQFGAGLTGAQQAFQGASQYPQYLQQLMNMQQQNALQQSAYPFQTAQWLSSILGSLGPLTGQAQQGTQIGTANQFSTLTPAQQNQWQQAAALGLKALPFFIKRGGSVPHYQEGGGMSAMPYGGARGYVPMPVGHQMQMPQIHFPEMPKMQASDLMKSAREGKSEGAGKGGLGALGDLLGNKDAMKGLQGLGDKIDDYVDDLINPDASDSMSDAEVDALDWKRGGLVNAHHFQFGGGEEVFPEDIDNPDSPYNRGLAESPHRPENWQYRRGLELLKERQQPPDEWSGPETPTSGREYASADAEPRALGYAREGVGPYLGPGRGGNLSETTMTMPDGTVLPAQLAPDRDAVALARTRGAPAPLGGLVPAPESEGGPRVQVAQAGNITTVPGIQAREPSFWQKWASHPATIFGEALGASAGYGRNSWAGALSGMTSKAAEAFRQQRAEDIKLDTNVKLDVSGENMRVVHQGPNGLQVIDTGLPTGKAVTAKETERHHRVLEADATLKRELALKTPIKWGEMRNGTPIMALPRINRDGKVDYHIINPDGSISPTPAGAPPAGGASGSGGRSSEDITTSAPPVEVRATAAPASEKARDEEYLERIAKDDPGYAKLIKGIADYQISPAQFSLRNNRREKAMADVVRYDPTYDQRRYNQTNKAITGWAQSPEGRGTRSFSVAIEHFGMADQLGKALENGDNQFLNQFKNWAKTKLGYEGPVNFEFAKQIVADEMAKAVIGGNMALADRENLQKQLSLASSPAQLAGVIKTAKGMIGGQLVGYRHQYETATGLHNFESWLTPQAAEEFRQISSEHKPASPGAGGGKGESKTSPGERFNQLIKSGKSKSEAYSIMRSEGY